MSSVDWRVIQEQEKRARRIYDPLRPLKIDACNKLEPFTEAIFKVIYPDPEYFRGGLHARIMDKIHAATSIEEISEHYNLFTMQWMLFNEVQHPRFDGRINVSKYIMEILNYDTLKQCVALLENLPTLE
jgi:hypothetical protein